MSDPPRPQAVTPRRLGDVVERVAARVLGDPATMVTGITHDSRQVRPGDLYVARAGERTHGIEHVAAARDAGAVAVLTDPRAAARAESVAGAVVVTDDPRAVVGSVAAWVYGDPARALTVLGITGTNGKTTTAYLLDAGLRSAGRRTGLLGTIETRIGEEVLPSARTTPEATDLQALFAVMRERGVDTVSMEVSSHALALGRVDGTVFEVSAFANLSQDHLDFHVDMDDYFAAKARLFTPPLSRSGVICIDDAWGRRLAAQVNIPSVTTGADPGAGWRRDHEVVDSSGGTARLIDPGGREYVVETRLPGRMNLSNAALAFVTLVRAGIDPAAARSGIAALPAVPGRMERVDGGQPFVALVDYAHTPDAVATLLREARRLTAPGGRVLVALGCGGDRDAAKRPMMGAAAAAGADLAVLTSDNPRSEDPAAILMAMRSGVDTPTDVVVEPDRRAAIDVAVRAAGPGDVVVIAGKGHEQGQEIAGRTLPFDDRQVLLEALTHLRTGAS